MKETSGPKVTMSSLKTGYTEVIYCPDFERLGNFSSDIIGIFRKHVLDVAMLASSEGVSVYFNDKKLPIKSFQIIQIIQVGKRISFYYRRRWIIRSYHSFCGKRRKEKTYFICKWSFY